MKELIVEASAEQRRTAYDRVSRQLLELGLIEVRRTAKEAEAEPAQPSAPVEA